MKLHLPKQLFTALLTAITLAAPAVVTLNSTAWGTNGYVDEPVIAGNCWADNYSFVFVWDGSSSADIGSVLTFYRGSATNDTYGYNAWSLNTETGILTVGRGKATNPVDNATGINKSTGFTYQDHYDFTTTIKAGVVYYVSVTGGNQTMKPSITKVTDATGETGTSYNGNMNGNAALTVASNSNYMVAADSIIWKSASQSAFSSVDNWTTVQGEDVTDLADKNLIFDASSDTAKTVDLSGSISVASIKVYGNYDFNATTATTLTTTSGLTIASGKKLTLQGSDITLSGTIANNGTLALENKLTLETTAERALGKVALMNGSTLEIFNKDGGRVVNISDLSITGSATVATTKSDTCHQGTINISDLSGTEATLVLKNGSQTSKNTLFNLGDSNAETSFSGTIRLQGAAATGGDRRTSLNINDADVAKGAVIEFYNDNSSNKSALGIGVSKVEIAGLQDVNADGTVNANGTSNVAIYGYKIGGGSTNFNPDTSDTGPQARTLEITGAGTYATKADINDGLNIIMNNAAGSQTFKGSANLGTVTVEAGSLTFSGATTLGGDVDNAGTLTFSGAVTIASGAEISITSADDSVTTFSNTLSGGKLTVSAGTVSYTRNTDKGYKVLDTVISSGATLEMKAGDSIDYDDTPGMTMTVEGTLDFGDEGRQTLGANFSLILSDGAVVTGGDPFGGLDFNKAGGSITSNGAASIQNGAIRLRNEDVKIDVQSGTLTTGTIVHNAVGATADIIKDGEGTLKITSMAQGGVNGSYQEVFFDGATTLKAGTVEYALTAAGTYNGTITGTGNIKNSGSAAVTLANIQNLTGTIQVDAGTLNITTLTNLQGALDINAGALSIGSLSAQKTIAVSIEEGATLNLGTVSVNKETHKLDRVSDTSFYSIDGENRSDNGYLVQTGTYVLFDGYQWIDGSVEGFVLETDGEKNQTLLSINGSKGTIFYVNTELSSSAISGASIASQYHVNDDGQFTIEGDVNGGQSAASLLTSTTGTGTLILDTDVTISGSGNGTVFEGTLKLDGSDLTGDSYRTLTVGGNPELANSVASLKEIVLAGQSKIQIKSNPTSETDIQKLTVAENGKGQLYIEDTNDAAMVIGEVQLKSGSGFTLGGKWQDSAITIGKLSGSGSFTYVSPSTTRQRVTIDSLLDFTGGLVLDNSGNHSDYSAVINTGTGSAVDFGSLVAKGSGTVLNVQTNTTVDTIDAAGGTVNLSAGTTLTLGGETASTSTIGTLTADADGNTIHLNSTATLNRPANVSGGTITLTGSGTYDMGASCAVNVNGLTDASNWTGTVKLGGAVKCFGGVDTDGIDHRYGNASSTVEMCGASGWLSNGLTMSSILKLTKEGEGENERNGFTVTAASNWEHTFSNKVRGNGDFTVAAVGQGNPKYFFTGDLSEWSGAFVVSAALNSQLIVQMTGGGDLFAADGGGIVVTETATQTIKATLGSTDPAVKTTMRGEVTNNSESARLNLTVQGDTDFKKGVDVTSLTVNSGKTATLTGDANSLTAGNATITSKAETDAALSNVTVQAGKISATSTANGAKGSISNADVEIAQLAQDATFTIADMTLTNTTITAATVDTKVNLSNVSASNLALAAGKFTMEATPAVGGGGTAVDFGTGVSSLAAGSATLTLNLDMMGAYESIGAVKDVTLTITLGVSGADFNSYTVENWQALVGFDGCLGTMLENQNATYQVADGAAQVSEGASTPAVSYGYAAGEGGSVGTLTITITGLNVPEPTTATLSLLALAALAARRRRND